ncbi:MAG: sterol desaturase family protein [Pseudomonadales bacterium]|nr:sterol desaturase family protein [Pseudomonadales bacterium]
MSAESTVAQGSAAEDVQREREIENPRDFLWALPQPILVLGSMTAVAFMVNNDRVNAELFALVMIMLPIPLLIVAERIWTKRRDWLLTPKEFAEDAFWLAFAAFVWIPIFSELYETPISVGFEALRDASPMPVALDSDTPLGLIGCAMLAMLASSFIYYWLHRVSHESLFFWRMHATHHHITKMGCLRGDRTHPLEWFALMLSAPVAFAFLGVSNEVLAVVGGFGVWNGTLNHSNLPLKSMPVYDWVCATAQQHHVHHAHDMRQSNSNYGCNLIIWDRVFGTYCGDPVVTAIGAGTGRPLSIPEQLALAFYPKKKLVSL